MNDEPADPFDSEENALGLIGDILGEASLLLDALREARQRGAILEAVFALSESDLRTLVIDRVLTEAFRDGFRGEEDE